MNGISLTQKILLAASDLPRDFHVGQLVVAAFKAFPGDFSLEGFGQYPDSNKVAAAMMGERGLVRRGLFERPQPKWYRLTAKGRVEAEAARDGKRHHVGPACLTAPEADALRSIVTCPAYTRYVGGCHAQINEDQARVFLSHKPAEIVQASRFAVVDGVVRLPDGGVVNVSHLDKIEACRVTLEKRFSRKLVML